MKTITTFPFKVQESEDTPIILPDGRRLSARIWRPVTDAPVPAILEYLPYRKTDGTNARDALTHAYLAGHGYACIRVDMQGTGDSEGTWDDEYSETELADGVDIITWIAAQSWCDGTLGMIGISWGGFNGLQIAMRQPEPLKAVVSLCATTDRYADDIHYKGGVMLGENTGWAGTVLGWFGLPPDPRLRDNWRDIWLKRLNDTPFLASTWVHHQHRDAYWKHASPCEDYASIKAAVLSVGGWHDGYRNTPPTLAANLSSPVKAIMGPWIHKYPHFAKPEPRIGFLQEMLRWFDHWLKGEDTGVAQDPAYRAYLMDGIAPATDYTERPGRWITEAEWPSPNINTSELFLSATSLGDSAPAPFSRAVKTDTDCGLGTGEYFPFGFGPGELPDDQAADDALSACFDHAPRPQSIDIVGAPRLSLTLASDQPFAQLTARLCDVAPNGQSTLISHGMLNLRHRDSHEHPSDLTPGTPVSVAFDLDHTAYRLPKGHSLRLALSPGYWPFLWPEPELVTLTISAGSLQLPLRPTAQGDEWQFEAPEAAPPWQTRQHATPHEDKQLTKSGDVTTLTITSDEGALEDLAHGLIQSTKMREIWQITKDQPASARSSFEWERGLKRGSWEVTTRAKVEQWADKSHFFVSAELTAYEGTSEVFTKRFEDKIPRK